MSQYPLSERPSSGGPTAFQEYWRLWADANYLGKVDKLTKDDDAGGDPQAVAVGELFQRYIFNCRPELLGVDTIRVPFTADRPQSLIINGFMLQGTTNIDSDVYVGGADTIYILAIRTVDSTTFTIELRTSPTEGTDERLIGQVRWDGAAFDANLLITYELEGFGLQHSDEEIVKAWVSFTGATGVILDSHEIISVIRDSTGLYTITWDTDFIDTSYAIVATASTAGTYAFCIINTIAAECIQLRMVTHTGGLIDPTTVYVIAIGAQEI